MFNAAQAEHGRTRLIHEDVRKRVRPLAQRRGALLQ
jgi:hypothetical protein